MASDNRQGRHDARLQLKQRNESNADAKPETADKDQKKTAPKKAAPKKQPAKNNDGAGKSNQKKKSESSRNSESKPPKRTKPRRGQGTKRFFTRKRVILIVGTILGLIIAHFAASHNATLELAEVSQEWLLSHEDMLPSSLVDLLQKDNEKSRKLKLSDDFAVGNFMYSEGFRPKHPVVMVPGVISSSLENWGLHGTEDCPSKSHYRKQMWGGFYMVRQMLLSKHCWLQHLLLDKDTGLDPPSFKVRASQGIESADYFITGYWIWNKIIENLAALGYDQNTMELASYDWRLGYPDLEKRDGYFSRLKAKCELNLKLTGEKSSILSHSMGSQVVFYFLKWVEASGPGFGNGGPQWVNDHVAHFVDISGSMLGTPKAVPALLSGEMKDTVTLNQLGVSALEKFFSRDERAEMLRTWPGIASMLPKGGEAIWGNMEGAPDDPKNHSETFGNFVRFADNTSLSARNLTLEQSLDFLFDESPRWFNKRIKSMYSFGLARTRAEVVANEKDPSKWSNPLEVSLPNAPDLAIYALYGVGKDTERAYFYKNSTNDTSTPLNAVIDYDNLESGSVVIGPGDGTISLPCHAINHRWKDANSKFNPASSKIKVVEMLHEPDKFDLRGGTQTADHVDILGRTELNEIILRIVSGRGEEVEERVISDIEEWVWDLDLGSN